MNNHFIVDKHTCNETNTYFSLSFIGSKEVLNFTLIINNKIFIEEPSEPSDIKAFLAKDYDFKESHVFDLKMSAENVPGGKQTVGKLFPLYTCVFGQDDQNYGKFVNNYYVDGLYFYLSSQHFYNEFITWLFEMNKVELSFEFDDITTLVKQEGSEFYLNEMNFIENSEDVLLIFSNNSLNNIATLEVDQFSIKPYYISLLKRGILFQELQFSNSESISWLKSYGSSDFDSITLKEVSSEISMDDYPMIFQMVYSCLVNMESNQYACFNMIYQFIEYLIQYIYDVELNGKVDEYIAIRGASTPGIEKIDAHRWKEEFSRLSNEKERLKLLRLYYDPHETLKVELDISKLFPEEKDGEFLDKIYKVRNLVVHNFRSLLQYEQYEDELKKINIIFFKSILELLITFKKPQLNSL